jgi:hypothetical protein
MAARLAQISGRFLLLLMAPLAVASQPAAAETHGLALVNRALAAELHSVRDLHRPMRYVLRKSSPRLTTTKEIIETKDGAVARLVAINDRPLSPVDELKEQARLNALLGDPSRQRHRKQSEDADTARALKVLRVLPEAFLFQPAGGDFGPDGQVARFTFRPNPNFDPPDLETQVLTAMSGDIWIDVAQQRVTRLEGHLQRDVDFGWGILGRLNKGGWIVIEQSDVGNHQWRVTHFQMSMTGRVLFKSRVFDTVEDQTRFAPLPVDLGYSKAIELLRSSPAAAVASQK